jgi:hypothetical protein
MTPATPRPSLLRTALPWLLLALVAAFAAWLRYGFIEPPQIAHQCDGGAGPGWCAFHRFLVVGFNSYGFGYAALAATVLALAWRLPLTAWLAAALGFAALLLYCADAGAVALLIGALRLLRSQAQGLPPGQRDGQGQGHAQPQP